MRVLSVLVLASLATASIGCADECTSAGDCKASDRCVEGACTPLPAPPILLPYDGGPDTGVHRDAANSDLPPGDAEVDGGGGGPGPGDGGDADDAGARGDGGDAGARGDGGDVGDRGDRGGVGDIG